MANFTDTAKEFAEETVKKRQLKDQIKEIDGKLARLQGEILKMMESDGIEKISLEGFGTIYSKENVSARVVDNDKLAKWMEEHDMADMGKYTIHNKRLVSLCASMLKNDDKTPDGVVVSTYTTISLLAS